MRGGYTVPPLSTAKIREVAATVRKRVAPVLGGGGFIRMDLLYEWMHLFLPGFDFEVCERDEMGDDHGQTFPGRLLIKLRNDVYGGMCRGMGRDRFTGAHELGHLFLHQDVSFARRREPSAPIYMDSEWQADTFASSLLIDEELLRRCRTVEEVMETFGVSRAAAEARFRK